MTVSVVVVVIVFREKEDSKTSYYTAMEADTEKRGRVKSI